MIHNFRYKGCPPTNHSSFQKTRLNDISHDIKICTDLSSILSQSTRLSDRQTDRQTDKILIARPGLHSMQRGNKMNMRPLSNCMNNTTVLLQAYSLTDTV